MLSLKIFKCILLFKMANCIYSSKECETERYTKQYTYGILGQYFYSLKTTTLYQCMEICSQYPLCKSFSFDKSKNCRLRKLTEKDIYMFNCLCGEDYYAASSIPKVRFSQTHGYNYMCEQV